MNDQIEFSTGRAINKKNHVCVGFRLDFLRLATFLYFLISIYVITFVKSKVEPHGNVIAFFQISSR